MSAEPRQVQEMFDRISPSYDRMNRLMSGGMDGAWRRRAVRAAGAGPGDAVLDVCCGTGDLALELRRAVGPSGRVVGLDFSPQMLAVARAKSSGVEWIEGDALALPFADDTFAAATVGWGVRNLSDRPGGFRDGARGAARRPRRLLEMSQPPGLGGAVRARLDRPGGARPGPVRRRGRGRLHVPARVGARLPRCA